jgi:ppGpp synthetase/RelA/SpoT-type nucleotidyltranferase
VPHEREEVGQRQAFSYEATHLWDESEVHRIRKEKEKEIEIQN